MVSFPRKRETKKGDVMGGRMDTRLRGYDKTHDVFPAKAGNHKKGCDGRKSGYPLARV